MELSSGGVRRGSFRLLNDEVFSSLNSKNIKASQELPYMERISLVSQPDRVIVTFFFFFLISFNKQTTHLDDSRKK